MSSSTTQLADTVPCDVTDIADFLGIGRELTPAELARVPEWMRADLVAHDSEWNDAALCSADYWPRSSSFTGDSQEVPEDSHKCPSEDDDAADETASVSTIEALDAPQGEDELDHQYQCRKEWLVETRLQAMDEREFAKQVSDTAVEDDEDADGTEPDLTEPEMQIVPPIDGVDDKAASAPAEIIYNDAQRA